MMPSPTSQTSQSQHGVSAPFLVWAMRRTGSTAMMRLLREICGRQGLEGEPLSRRNSLGPAAEQFLRNGDFNIFRSNLEDRLLKRPMFKHCYDYLELPVHAALLKVTHELGYRHVVLHRRDELARALSLELARQTGHWGEAATKNIYDEIRSQRRRLYAVSLSSLDQHIHNSRLRRDWLLRQMLEMGANFHGVFFEDIFGRDSGHRTIQTLIDFIQLDVAGDTVAAERIASMLASVGQQSREIAQLLPNYHEITAFYAKQVAH